MACNLTVRWKKGSGLDPSASLMVLGEELGEKEGVFSSVSADTI